MTSENIHPKKDLESDLIILMCRLDAIAHVVWLACSSEVFAIDTQAIHHVMSMQQQMISEFQATHIGGAS